MMVEMMCIPSNVNVVCGSTVSMHKKAVYAIIPRIVFSEPDGHRPFSHVIIKFGIFHCANHTAAIFILLLSARMDQSSAIFARHSESSRDALDLFS